VFASSCRLERLPPIGLDWKVPSSGFWFHRRGEPERSIVGGRRVLVQLKSAIPATPANPPSTSNAPLLVWRCRCLPRRAFFSGHWIRRGKYFPGSWPHYTPAGPCGEESERTSQRKKTRIDPEPCHDRPDVRLGQFTLAAKEHRHGRLAPDDTRPSGPATCYLRS